MQSIGRIFLKDLRRFWPLVAAALVLDVLLGFFPALGIDLSNPTEASALDLASGVRLFILGLIAVAVVHEDLVNSDRSSWITRPVGPWRLLAAKLLFLAVTLAVPTGVCALVVSRQYHFGLRTSSAIGWENGRDVLLETVALACLGSMTSSLLATGIALVGLTVIFALIQPYLGLLGVFGVDWFVSSGLNATAVLLALLAVLAYQYASRRVTRAAWLAVLAGVLAVSVARIIDILRASPPPIAADVRLEAADPRGFVGGVSERPFPLADKLALGLQVREFTSLDSNYYVFGGQSTFSAANGIAYAMPAPSRSWIPDAVDDDENGLHSAWKTYAGFAGAVGVPLRLRESVVHNLEVLELPPEKFEQLRGLSGTLTTRFTISQARISNQGTLPLQIEASLASPGKRVRIESIRLGAAGAIQIVIHTTGVTSRHGAFYRLWALVNDKQNEVSLSGLQMGQWGWADTYALRDRREEIDFQQRWQKGSSNSTAGLDPTWLKDARLVFVDISSDPPVSADLVVPDFVMPKVGGAQ